MNFEQMERAASGIVLAGSLISGIHCNHQYNAIEKVRQQLVSNIVNLRSMQSLKSDQDAITQFEIKEPVAMVRLYEQKVMTRTDRVAVPTNSYGVTADLTTGRVMPTYQHHVTYNTVETNYLGFTSCPTHDFITKQNFGTKDLVMAKKVKSYVDHDMLDCVAADFQADGKSVMEYLKSTYNYTIRLKPYKQYKIKCYTLEGKSLYFFGRRFGDKFLCTNYGTDPDTVAEKGVSSSGYEFGAGMALVFGVMSGGYLVTTLIRARL
jgi:hypothetical protein